MMVDPLFFRFKADHGFGLFQTFDISCSPSHFEKLLSSVPAFLYLAKSKSIFVAVTRLHLFSVDLTSFFTYHLRTVFSLLPGIGVPNPGIRVHMRQISLF